MEGVARPPTPTQAVILAGGRGLRMRPYTDARPKPMFEVHGRPFLEYLFEMLAEQGLRRVLLLLGYLPEVVRDHFGDGGRWGVSIEYSVSAEADETGERLRRALPLLDPLFLLLYCDNYWPLRIDALCRRFAEADAPAMLTVYENQDGYTRDNVRLDEAGYIVSYDRGRTAPGLKGVEIGYSLIRRTLIEGLPDGNVSFEETTYTRLAARRQLLAFRTGHRYYSIGSMERVSLTESFLARRPAVLVDRDGVLNRKPPRAEYVRSWEEFEWLPDALDALRLFHETGYRVIVVSNQAGVARGALSEEGLAAIHDRMRSAVRAAGGRIDAVYHCPHDWDAGCDCRKPKPGMLYRAQREFDLDLTRVCFIGDDERDLEAARAAGCRGLLAREAGEFLDHARRLTGGGRTAPARVDG
ncbi:MAG: HAD-IIIA family hydrolase [Planctomycetes bacterium]|nr:HAD-IIIA family hydrolase [Planctomycetota bacterium]